jgi:hypothetical protein
VHCGESGGNSYTRLSFSRMLQHQVETLIATPGNHELRMVVSEGAFETTGFQILRG